MLEGLYQLAIAGLRVVPCMTMLAQACVYVQVAFCLHMRAVLALHAMRMHAHRMWDCAVEVWEVVIH